MMLQKTEGCEKRNNSEGEEREKEKRQERGGGK